MRKIDANKSGACVVLNHDRSIFGIITDGDARRYILEGNSIQDLVTKSCNTKFTSVRDDEPKENILKLLDNQVAFLPVVDCNGSLVRVYTRFMYPIEKEKGVIIRSRAPVRISFGGGGTDLTYFFCEHGGAVINTTINMYAHCQLRILDEKKIVINSIDLDVHAKVDQLKELQEYPELKLIYSLLNLINPIFGFELTIYCDYPVGSGLGGSSAVLAAIQGAFNQLRRDPWDMYEIAELSFQAERIHSNVSGGWQDQYASVFGGFNFIEFSKKENIVHPLRINRRTLLELEENLILCKTWGGRSSGDIHKDQRKKVQSNEEIKSLALQNKDLSYRIKSHLLKGNVSAFGRLLHEGWCLKKEFSGKVSTDELDSIYNFAIEAGATGGKLLGAGGGGYFLFYVDWDNKPRVKKALEERGVISQNFSFEQNGLQSWKVRE